MAIRVRADDKPVGMPRQSVAVSLQAAQGEIVELLRNSGGKERGPDRRPQPTDRLGDVFVPHASLAYSLSAVATAATN
jgi:hypothetical protein